MRQELTITQLSQVSVVGSLLKSKKSSSSCSLHRRNSGREATHQTASKGNTTLSTGTGDPLYLYHLLKSQSSVNN
eukprot:scaffold5455_cov145-Skeletonema_menzelii.AAC.8